MGTIPAPNIVEAINQMGQDALAIRQQQSQLQHAAQERQANALTIQQQRLALQDQQTLRSIAPQYVQKNSSGQITGFDTDGFFKAASGSGVSPITLNSMQANWAKAQSDMANATKAERDNQNAINTQGAGMLEDLKGVTDPDQRQQGYTKAVGFMKGHGVDVSSFPAQVPQNNDDLTHLEIPLGMHAELVNQGKTQSETNANNAKAANENAQAALAQIKVNLAKNSKPGDFDSQIDAIFSPSGASQVNGMYKSLINSALRRGDLDSAKQYVDQAAQSQQAIYKEFAIATNPQIQAGKAQTAAAEAKATQPYKLEVAAAEAKAKQLIEGTAQPVYAYDPTNNTTSLMSKTEALQAGLKAIRPVTSKEVTDDTMLINRLSDVRQKIARYEQSLQQPVSYNDKSTLGALLDSQKLRVGAFGTEFPTGRFDAMLQAENLQHLSPAARDQLVAYRNAREALVGYNRVLSGSGKSSDKSLELQEQTLPDPSVSDRDFAIRSIGQFKENLSIVGQGLPNIPGVKTPEQWEQQITNPGPAPKAGTVPLSSLIHGSSRQSQSQVTFPRPPIIPLSSLLGQ